MKSAASSFADEVRERRPVGVSHCATSPSIVRGIDVPGLHARRVTTQGASATTSRRPATTLRRRSACWRDHQTAVSLACPRRSSAAAEGSDEARHRTRTDDSSLTMEAAGLHRIPRSPGSPMNAGHDGPDRTSRTKRAPPTPHQVSSPTQPGRLSRNLRSAASVAEDWPHAAAQLVIGRIAVPRPDHSRCEQGAVAHRCV
jgi:hypothetical protein